MHLRPIWFSLPLFCALSTHASAQGASRSGELQKLDFFIGNWNEAGQMRDDPTKPFAAISGDETCQWAKGGFVVLCEEKTGGPGGGWEGVYILGYDPLSKKYHVHGIERPGNNMHAIGQVVGKQWTWLTDPAPDGSQVRYTFAPATAAARTLVVEVGSANSWAAIANVTYSPRK
jgi:hypothetical protein